MRKIIYVLFLVVFLFSHPFASHAADTNDSFFTVQEWFSWGDAGWQISFPYMTGLGDTGIIESELSFKKIDSAVTIVKGAGALNPEWTLAAAYGFGSITGGRGTDTDRFISPTSGTLVFSESREDISGDVRFWEISLVKRKKFLDGAASPWGLVIGLFHYEDKLLITNGVQTVSQTFDGMTFPPVGTIIAGIRSTYDFYWNALKVGASREWRQSEGISVQGMLALYPYIDYQGEGYWNLRVGPDPDDFRPQPPSFTHEATSGLGYEASVGMNCRITETSEFTIGYRYLYLKAKNGTDITYFNAGIGIANLDFAEVTRQGMYAGFLFRF